MFIAGMSAITTITMLFVITFFNGVIMALLTSMIMSGTYTRAFGMNNIPIIQNLIWWMILIAAIISIIWVVIEAFSEVSYYPDV
jgi:hypothetical protein